MISTLANAVKAVRRGALAATIAAVGVVAGASLALTVAAQPGCEEDGCQKFITLQYCADGHSNCQCDMHGSTCTDEPCDPEMPDDCGGPIIE